MSVLIGENVSVIGAREPADALVVFDLGGTWFRSGIFAAGRQILQASRLPAITYVNHPNATVESLQQKLVEYVVTETSRLFVSTEFRVRAAALSVGAAVDCRSGFILNAGQWWGLKSRPFDLRRQLKVRAPRFDWHVVNDVTAALLRHVEGIAMADARRAALITISTGIAVRTYDVASASVAFDRVAGLQGEIGHIPIVFAFRGRTYDLNCDCGGANHLNAFCSGRGIARTIRLLAARDAFTQDIGAWPARALELNDAGLIAQFSEALSRSDPLAHEILDALIAPIARRILTMIAIDPLIERLFVVGGVVQALSPLYIERLRQMIGQMGVYQISTLDPEFISSLLRAGFEDDASGLIGAGLSFATKVRD
jgi:2-epi-5-epi-valiolone 7-kinase